MDRKKEADRPPTVLPNGSVEPVGKPKNAEAGTYGYLNELILAIVRKEESEKG